MKKYSKNSQTNTGKGNRNQATLSLLKGK